ncbi:protein of unknown function [Salinimicrobium catena]|uniref:DUF4271 domain-containing protein n=1 Tax=Salinimicrobium catena TaxID=390640 RepID=A0A1H5JKA2_9FLAO|nr:DUF4271 domain-containing protein [Salinimicrobium catena]SDK88450.1 protein of unknown function [Salinimicrobium catena]SEE52993.1 protein of unknown function [Salinimicrobium catena]
MEAIERHVVGQDWITLLLLLVLVVLVATKYTFPQRFNHFVMLFATDKYLLLKGKDPKIFHPFNLLFFTVNIITVALFIFIFYNGISEDQPDRPKVLYLRIATAYATFVLLKFTIEKILANIVSADKQLNFYLFYKLSYRNFMALVLLPVCMAFIYIWEPSILALYICIGILLLMNLITILSLYRKNQQFILTRWFYFILYLCALEIGPYFILYKLITKL